MNFKNLSLGKKITLAGVLFLMPIFLVCMFNIYKVRTMQQLYISLDVAYRAMSEQAAEAHSYFLMASLESDPQTAKSLITKAEPNINKISELARNSEVLGTEITDEAKSLVLTYGSLSRTSAAQLAELAQRLESDCLTGIENRVTEVCEWVKRSNTEQAIGYILCIAIGLFTLLTLVGKIIRPIDDTVKHTSTVTGGDLRATLLSNGATDEVGRLRTSVSRLTNFLRDTFGSIGSEVGNITEASSFLESSARDIRSKAANISESTNEVGASIEEFAASVEQNSHNSVSGAQMADAALTSVSECNMSALQTVSAMNEITDRISIINSIAFQTNILALNAAVEASRAGESGKGFAVVASDIRKLAERSALAAKEINAVSVTGSQAARTMQDVFTKILPEISKTADLIREISASSQEQAATGSRINTAVQNFTQVTRNFAGIADEVAENSAILLQRSEELSEAISYFKTE